MQNKFPRTRTYIPQYFLHQKYGKSYMLIMLFFCLSKTSAINEMIIISSVALLNSTFKIDIAR